MKKAVWISMIPYAVFCLAAFYLIPLAGMVFHIGDTGYFMMTLLVVTPLICILSGVAFAARCGFVWYYPVLIALLFIPAVFVFYSRSALVYAVTYGILTLAGCGFGKLVQRK